MSKRNLIIDVALCENCHNCSLATKDEHIGNDFPGYAAPQPLHGHDWIKIERRVRGNGTMVDAAYLPTMCNHCDNAPCLQAAGDDGSVRKRADGVVIIDPDKARGRRDLVDSCPYGAIWWNEALQLPQIWIFDAHLLDAGWPQPRCQQSCPTGAIEMATLEDDAMQAKAAAERLEVLRPELGTRPRVYYRNLHRFQSQFLGGTLVAHTGGVEDCLPGAEVSLWRNGEALGRQRTDLFGDFKFDGLEPADDYRLVISCEGFASLEREAAVGDDSCYLGVLRLEALDASDG